MGRHCIAILRLRGLFVKMFRVDYDGDANADHVDNDDNDDSVDERGVHYLTCTSPALVSTPVMGITLEFYG